MTEKEFTSEEKKEIENAMGDKKEDQIHVTPASVEIDPKTAEQPEQPPMVNVKPPEQPSMTPEEFTQQISPTPPSAEQPPEQPPAEPEKPFDPTTMNCDQMQERILNLSERRSKLQTGIDSLNKTKEIIPSETIDKAINESAAEQKKADDEICNLFERFTACATQSEKKPEE